MQFGDTFVKAEPTSARVEPWALREVERNIQSVVVHNEAELPPMTADDPVQSTVHTNTQWEDLTFKNRAPRFSRDRSLLQGVLTTEKFGNIFVGEKNAGSQAD